VAALFSLPIVLGLMLLSLLSMLVSQETSIVKQGDLVEGPGHGS